MSAVLAKCLQDIIRKVEKISAKKVRLVEKRGMNMPVIVKVARPEVPAHLLYFDPTHGDISYHSIAHECVHILRLFEAEPGKRIVPIATSTRCRVFRRRSSFRSDSMVVSASQVIASITSKATPAERDSLLIKLRLDRDFMRTSL